jgi:hypothetical protein
MPARKDFADEHAWQDAQPAPDQEELLAPRTQIVADRDAYLGQGRHDVGRRISDDQVELFASVDAATALEMEFRQHDPSFIAVHDVGTSASLRLLTSIGSAMGARMQRLSIRKQGHGMAMAVLQFLEVPLADGTPVRVYATDVNTEQPLRGALARVLLAHSRLGVMLMGSVQPQTLTAQLQPIGDAIQSGPWPNRELLMVPLGAGVALAEHAARLAGRSGVAVHVTPTSGKTRQAWAYIGGAWNRLNGGAGGEHTMRADFDAPASAAIASSPEGAVSKTVPRSEAPTEPMGLQPLPPARLHPSHPAASQAHTVSWQSDVDSCAVLKGAIACSAFDTTSAHELAHAGHASTAAPLADHGFKLLKAMSEATRAFGVGQAPTDGALSTPTHHFIVRPVPGHPNVALHLVLAASTNLTLAKLQLERVAPPPASSHL